MWIAIHLVPGFHSPDGFIQLLLTLLLFGITNVLIRPFFVFLAFPLILITVGPFVLLLNTSLILLCALLAGFFGLDFKVNGFVSALVGAVTISFVRIMFMGFFEIGKRKLAYRKEKAWARKLEKWKIWSEGQISHWQRIIKEREQIIQQQRVMVVDPGKDKIATYLSDRED
jgi:uncharacterized membrane protein YvlD (DUF360 family)